MRFSSSRSQPPSGDEQDATMRSAKAVVSENRYSGLDRSQFNGSLPQDHSRMPTRTITGLKRWSVASRELPGGFDLHVLKIHVLVRWLTVSLRIAAISQVKAIHVYDFDNTCKSFTRSDIPFLG